MYRKKDRSIQQQIQFITLEDLVPQNHILRKIDRAIDFNFIYEEVEGLYSPCDMGRPGIDPVSLFKIVFIQYLFGIRSMRQTIKEIDVNVAYRWFIGYGLLEQVPHFSTFSKNYARRFQGTAVFEHIFQHILEEAVNAGFVDASAIVIDGTHIKASANKNKSERVTVTKPVKQYQKELDDEIDWDREKQGKGKLPPREEKQETTITQSKTDPESGLFVKGEHERQFAYVANTACDKHNFILDFVVGAGNVHDSQMFHNLYEKLERISQATESIVVDAGYKTPGIAREILQDGKIPVVPYKRPMTKEGFFKKQEYVYDEYYDCYLCPENQVLKYATTNREGYREYKSDPKICAGCPYLKQCTKSINHQKAITRHIWQEYMEICEDIRHTKGMKEIYSKRKETIERDFGTAKEHHAMRYTQQIGKEKMAMKVGLTFACMNMKKLANMLWNYRRNEPTGPVDSSTKGASSLYLHDFLSILRNILNFSEYIPVYDSI